MKRYVVAFLASLALGVAGLVIVGGRTVIDRATYAAIRPDPVLMGAAMAAVLAQWLLPAMRLVLLARPQRVRVPVITAIGLHLTYMLGSAVTPGGSGGGPALAAAWRALGLPWGRGIAIAVQILMLDVTVLAVLAAGGATYLVASGAWRPSTLTVVLIMIAAAGGAALALALAAAHRTVARWLLWFDRCWTSRRRHMHAAALRGSASGPAGVARRGAPRLAREYLRAAAALRSAPPGVRASLWAVNAGGWIAQFAALWALLNLYQPTPLLPVAASLAIASFAAVAVPTPGASGAMEVLVGLGALAHYDRAVVAAPILIWRLATFYVVFLLGPLAGAAIAVRHARAR